MCGLEKPSPRAPAKVIPRAALKLSGGRADEGVPGGCGRRDVPEGGDRPAYPWGGVLLQILQNVTCFHDNRSRSYLRNSSRNALTQPPNLWPWGSSLRMVVLGFAPLHREVLCGLVDDEVLASIRRLLRYIAPHVYNRS